MNLVTLLLLQKLRNCGSYVCSRCLFVQSCYSKWEAFIVAEGSFWVHSELNELQLLYHKQSQLIFRFLAV